MSGQSEKFDLFQNDTHDAELSPKLLFFGWENWMGTEVYKPNILWGGIVFQPIIFVRCKIRQLRLQGKVLNPNTPRSWSNNQQTG